MSDLIEAVREAVGIYGASPTCHLSALARVPGYRREHLDAAVEQDRTLARVRAMRRSVHLFDRETLAVAVAALRERLLRSYQAPSKQVDGYEDLAGEVEGMLEDGPRPASEIRDRIDPEREMGYRFSVLLGRMAAECRIVRATSEGGWRSDRLTYALWSRWLPEVDPWAIGEEEGMRQLAEAYVAAYGPVTVDDLAWWTGWTKTATRAVAEEVDLDGEGGALERLDGVRLLPHWDVLMVAWRERERLFDREAERFLYDSSGNATSVVLDGGRVVGVWDLGREDDPLEVKAAPLGTWPKRRWRDLEEQVERIAEMLGGVEWSLVRVEEPVDLREASRNRFLSPLKEEG